MNVTKGCPPWWYECIYFQVLIDEYTDSVSQPDCESHMTGCRDG